MQQLFFEIFSNLQIQKRIVVATIIRGNTVDLNVEAGITILNDIYFRNLFPPNIIQACTKQVTTDLIYNIQYTDSENNETLDKRDWAFKTSMKDNTNILGM